MQNAIQRIDYIDIAKGIGMILVCIGHFDISTEKSFFYDLFIWIYSFHMPLFFFISGMLFSYMQITSKIFLKRKLVTLLIPYTIFSIYNWLLLSIFHIETQQFIIYGWGRNPLWFIPVLFLIELFHFYIIRGAQWQKILPVILLVILFMWKTSYNEWLPYAVSELPWFYLCYLSGFLFKPCIVHFNDIQSKKAVILPIILFTIHFFVLFDIIMPYNPNYRLQDDDLLSYIFRYVIGMIGTLALIFLSMRMEQLPTNILKWVGRNSLVILCVHWPYFKILQKINPQEIEMGGANFVIVILLCYVSVSLYNKYIKSSLIKLNAK